MAPGKTLNTRWVTVIMVAALVCSVAVVLGLIQITGHSPASSSSPAAGASASPSPEASSSGASSPGASARASSPDGTSGEPSPPDQADAAAHSASPTESVGSDQLSGATRTPDATATTPPPVLPGSGLQLPVAWTGTAEMTITVLGRCAATGGTSSYTRRADLALQGPVQGTGPFDDPNPLSMTLGITPTGIPGLSLYSASTDQSGVVRRLWWLSTAASTGPAGDGRTNLFGVLIDDQPVRGVLPPNLLVDNETDLQPCESGGMVRVPRTLAAGSTVTGWVSATQAHLDVTAHTVDGERAVTAVVEMVPRPGA
jgi:hypothetical protein